MEIKALRRDLEQWIGRHYLTTKWRKSVALFQENIRHPSLHVELLEPHWRGIYSFRLDRKYRALFFITEGKAEIFRITLHYKKR